MGHKNKMNKDINMDDASLDKAKKAKKYKFTIIFGSAIVLIPIIVFATILVVAQLSTGKPIIGSRFKDDLETAITSDQIKDLQSSIKDISGVEDCEAVLESAQLRVNVKVTASTKDEAVKEMASTVYKKVTSKLSLTTYFTSHNNQKMYDLAINVYNQLDNEDGNQIYYLLTKNAKMSEPSIQLVSKPLDENLAKELRGEIVDDSIPTEPILEQEETETEEEQE